MDASLQVGLPLPWRWGHPERSFLRRGPTLRMPGKVRSKVPFLSTAPVHATEQTRDGHKEEKRGTLVKLWTRLPRPTRGGESPLTDEEQDLRSHASSSMHGTREVWLDLTG